MVSCCVFFGNTLRDDFMQIFQDVKCVDKVIVVFDYDEYKAIVRESTKTKRQIKDVMKDVLESGFRNLVGTLYCKAKQGG